MQEQDLFGIGRGAAQVVGNNRTMQAFFNIANRRAMLEQRDQAMLQEMVQGYDPAKMKGLQAKDVADYQQMYTKWKGLYLSNKDLMKNPARYPEQYREAEQLKTQMATLVRFSEQDKQFNDDFAQEYIKNKNRYFDGSVQGIYDNRAVPVMQQLATRGRLLDWSDVELNYTPPDAESVSKQVKRMANGLSPELTKFRRDIVAKGGTSGLDITEDMVQDVEIFDPRAVRIAFDTFKDYDANNLKGYNQMFSRMTPAEKQEYAARAKETAGVDIQINNGEDLGYADFLIKGSMIKGAPKREENKDMVREIKRKEKAEDIQMQEAKETRMLNRQLAKQKAFKTWERATSAADNNDDPSGLLPFADKIVQSLQNGDLQSYTQAISESFDKKVLGMQRPIVADPRMMTEDDYVRKYYQYINPQTAFKDAAIEPSVDPSRKSDRLAEGQSKQAFEQVVRHNYRNGKMMMYVPISVEGEGQKWTVIDPSIPSSRNKLFTIMNQGFQFKATQNPANFGIRNK